MLEVRMGVGVGACGHLGAVACLRANGREGLSSTGRSGAQDRVTYRPDNEQMCFVAGVPEVLEVVPRLGREVHVEAREDRTPEPEPNRPKYHGYEHRERLSADRPPAPALFLDCQAEHR